MEKGAEGIWIQPRDVALLRSLFESRLLTLRQASLLHFNGRAEAAKKRIQKLKAHGLMRERPRRVSEPSVVTLTNKGIELLRAEGILALYPPLSAATLRRRATVSDRTVAHEVAVGDIRAAFAFALAQSPDYSFQEFSTWPLLTQFEAARHSFGGPTVLVKPDGFLRILKTEPDGRQVEFSYFLEYDHSTETLDTLLGKAACYHNYLKSGDYAVWRGQNRVDGRNRGFRVLMVFKTEERRDWFASAALAQVPPLASHILLSTLEEACGDPMGAIWVRPDDYLELTEAADGNLRRKNGKSKFNRNALHCKMVIRKEKTKWSLW